jgi:hypothetical protein
LPNITSLLFEDTSMKLGVSIPFSAYPDFSSDLSTTLDGGTRYGLPQIQFQIGFSSRKTQLGHHSIDQYASCFYTK